MSGTGLILRPEPGAGATAARARAGGLEPVVSPLFSVRPLAWEAPPPSGYDAVLLTSANAARHGGGAFTSLPCYAVGEATALAAAAAGYADVQTGPSDGAAAAAMMAEDGVRRVLHLCGRERLAVSAERLIVDRRPVYAADPIDALPITAEQALARGAIVLLHSARAAALFATLVGEARRSISIAALSPAVAVAAGEGWKSRAAPARPRDEALLELAAQLCQIGSQPGSVGG